MKKLQFPAGHLFGKLELITYLPTEHGASTCLFRCLCGTFTKRQLKNVVRTAKTQIPCCLECGKQSKINNGKKQRTHGVSVDNPRLYDVHRQMMKRCYDPRCKDYPNYGERGIGVCQEWRNILRFVEWAISTGYERGLTIERIDVNSGYSPDNCKWIPNEQQAHNTRIVRKITIDGETKVISEWSKVYGVPISTIKNRLRAGWQVDLAIKTPSFVGRNQFTVTL